MFEFLMLPLLNIINPRAPINPIKTPITWLFLGLELNKMIPIINANIGVSELSIPLSELVISVCAFVNRNAIYKIKPYVLVRAFSIDD